LHPEVLKMSLWTETRKMRIPVGALAISEEFFLWVSLVQRGRTSNADKLNIDWGKAKRLTRMRDKAAGEVNFSL